MKRKFILLPIALTALTPVIGLSGCKDGGEDKPEPTPTKKIKMTLIKSQYGDWNFVSDIIESINKDTMTEFIADDLSPLGEEVLPDNYAFLLLTGESRRFDLYFSSCKVYVNGNEVTYDKRNDPKKLEDHHYTYYVDDDVIEAVHLKYSNISKNDYLCFEFNFTKEYKSGSGVRARIEVD